MFFFFFKKNFSTSPEQEPEDFINNLKESFNAMITYINPHVTYFNNKSNIYIKQSNGTWSPVSSSNN
jgi:hypothetical protein